jgi:hypothetical protein
MEFLKSTPKRLLCLSWRRQDVGFKGAGGLQDLRRMYDILYLPHFVIPKESKLGYGQVPGTSHLLTSIVQFYIVSFGQICRYIVTIDLLLSTCKKPQRNDSTCLEFL